MASTPLYKRLREKGTTFISFPSASNDFNVYSFQDQYDMHVSKFILLNIPTSDWPNGPALNFSKTNSPIGTDGTNMYNFDPNGSYPVKYSERLVESLRNYIANQDTCFRESRIASNKDFYNPLERKNPTEMIFWKWCRLNNIIDLEPAEHKIDWDKNMSDFDNPFASTITNADFFRKYLWKEREVKNYDCSVVTDGTYAEVNINSYSKFRIGDEIYFSGVTASVPVELSGITHTITSILIGNDQTTLTLGTDYIETNSWSGQCYLSYHRLVEYIGEVQYNSKVRSSQQTFTEFGATVAAHAGKSPTVLFETTKNTNYYPGLQLPILDEQIQDEIIGAENLTSPIRTNPNDYPGSYFGYFDTYDKTYNTSTGDAVRYSGEYYGVLKNDNYLLANDDYFEQLTDFDSSNIDGLSIDFNLKHYFKAQTAKAAIETFDEFNTISINDEPPLDFEFNAILWYYTVHDHGNNKTYDNLYGIELMDNPDNDFGSSNDNLITPIKKLVSNDNQDGYSFIYNLNLDFKVDNDMITKYDPTTLYNSFGFDMYNKVMSNYVLLSEQFTTIIGEYIHLNDEIVRLKSLIYSQTDISDLKNRMANQEMLLKMYKTNQFVDSSTVKMNIDYTKNYPALSFDAVNVDYSDIITLKTTDIAAYNLSMSGQSQQSYAQIITVPTSGKFLVNVLNDMIIAQPDLVLSITLDKDLGFKQSVDFIIRPDIAIYSNELNINVLFYDGTPNPRVETTLISLIDTPVDVTAAGYNPSNPTGSTFSNSHYLEVFTFIDRLTTGASWADVPEYDNYTTIDLKDDLFSVDDYVYIENLYLTFSASTTPVHLDFSGLYKIVHIVGIQAVLELDLNGQVFVLSGTPKVHYYKGIKIGVLRVDESDTSDITHRYLITKEFINEKILSTN